MDMLLRLTVSARTIEEISFVLGELERTPSVRIEDRVTRAQILQQASVQFQRWFTR